ncbi:DUF3556 domain-containing protein [Nocardia abscessus]|uniref:DUF3556 domain-containing protein n=1 Tax=Nocardia abscessus TaxID=120957 RepID=UPI0024539504|nr:DUF3556 domain-containing protein [Nocardia abscessus]
MGFKTADFPPVNVETFLDQPLRERMRTLALHWVEYGFGTPKMIHTIYLLKVALVSVLAGVALARPWRRTSATSAERSKPVSACGRGPICPRPT